MLKKFVFKNLERYCWSKKMPTQARRKANKHRWGGFSTARINTSRASFHLLFFITRILKSIFIRIKIYEYFFNLFKMIAFKFGIFQYKKIVKTGHFCERSRGRNSWTCSSKRLEITLLGCYSQSRSSMRWNYCSAISGCKD